MRKPADAAGRYGDQPITEGYQPGQFPPFQKGYAPAGDNTLEAPPPPPSGGSSVAKPPRK